MSAQQQQPITGFHDLPLEKLDEAPFNPRTHFDVQKLADLQASIEARGVLVPLLVRPHLNRYQILCGARRYRAAKAAGLAKLPCKVVLLNDPEALEVAVIENLQREDVHPLEEAEGFRALLEHGYDVPGIAAKIGKDETYIYRRLALLKLSTKAREALEGEKITPAHERLQFGNAAHVAALARLEELPKLLAGWEWAFTRRTWRGQLVKPRVCVQCKQFVESPPRRKAIHVIHVFSAERRHYRRSGGQWIHRRCFEELARELEGLKARFL